MATPEIHRLLLQPLHRTGITYMITGSVAAIAYGEPRMTNGVDLVLDMALGDAERLAAAFPATEYYSPPLEVMEQERQRPNSCGPPRFLSRRRNYIIRSSILFDWSWLMPSGRNANGPPSSSTGSASPSVLASVTCRNNPV